MKPCVIFALISYFLDPYDADYLPSSKVKVTKEDKKPTNEQFVPEVSRGRIIPDKKRRRKRRPKGYSWGINGSPTTAKSKRPSRPPLVPKNSDIVGNQLQRHAGVNRTKKQPDMPTVFPTLNKMVENCTNTNSNNGTHLQDQPSTTTCTRPILFDVPTETKRVLVASVKVNAPKRTYSVDATSTKPFSPKPGYDSLAKDLLSDEPKRRRRSAIAGENFVASCLLFSKNSRKPIAVEKKRSKSHSRPLQNVDEDQNSLKMEETPQKQEILKHNADAKVQLTKTDAKVAFAQPWFSSLTPGSSKLSQFSNSSFNLANSNKLMSFRAANAHAQKTTMPLKLDSVSLTAYRDMTQYDDDPDEENDVTSSSSSDSESSSSSVDSSYDLTSDEDPIAKNRVESSFEAKWRHYERPKKLMKKKTKTLNQLAGTLAEDKQVSVAPPIKLDRVENAASLSTADLKVAAPAKRKRGRPRKYPLKPDIQKSTGKPQSDPNPKTQFSSFLNTACENGTKRRQSTEGSPIAGDKSAHDLKSEENPDVSITNLITSTPKQQKDEPRPTASNHPFHRESFQKETRDCEKEIVPVSPMASSELKKVQVVEETRCDSLASKEENSSSDEEFKDVESEEESSRSIEKGSSVEVGSTFVSKRDPTLSNWHSEQSSLQGSLRASGENECDSHQSSSLFSGVPLDDSLSSMFPNVDAIQPSTSESIGNENMEKNAPPTLLGNTLKPMV